MQPLLKEFAPLMLAYTSCHLVPLDKCPGVRPVGIGEVVCRIVGKAVMKVVKRDLQGAIGSVQLCSGQEAGCEAAVHAMENIRELLALPVRLGGLGLQNPITMSREQHTASKLICAPLVDRIVNQDHHLGECSAVQQGTKARLCSRKHNQQNEEAKNFQNQLSSSLQRSMELSQEKGASAWLTSLPINDHGFALHKSAFRDALSPVWLVTTKSTITLYLWPSIQH